MFANPIWSILLIAAPLALYWFVIRPRLRTKLTELYANIDSFWGRVWARTYAFRTFWIAAAGAVITALPDILVTIAPLDFSGILPQPWPAYTGPATTIAITLMKAFETKPGEQS
jgi:hypothetical protein